MIHSIKDQSNSHQKKYPSRKSLFIPYNRKHRVRFFSFNFGIFQGGTAICCNYNWNEDECMKLVQNRGRCKKCAVLKSWWKWYFCVGCYLADPRVGRVAPVPDWRRFAALIPHNVYVLAHFGVSCAGNRWTHRRITARDNVTRAPLTRPFSVRYVHS